MNSSQSIATRFLTSLFAALACIFAAMAADAKEPGEQFKPRTTITQTNLRKGPRMESEILTLIPKGTTIGVGDCVNGWCRVSWNRQDGYAIGRNLGIAAAPWWPNALFAAGVDDHRSSQNTAKTARKHEEDEEHERDQSYPEHSFILEIGTAGEWPLDGERPNFGGTIAGEVEPIENWLELEAGFTTLGTSGHTELSGDLLFKKPFHLSSTAEFMVGLGPSFSRTINGLEQGNSWSVEFALDWMFWPTKDVGWFIEPTWSVNPRNGQQSAAVSIGILIGFPK
jgi:Bacterial SH3 domain